MTERSFYVLVVSVFISAFILNPVYAERLFKLVDEYGNVTYQTAPPSGDDSGTVEQRDIYGGEDPPEEVIARERAAFDHPVVLYAVANCKPCDTARTQLEKRKIPFKEKDPTSEAKLYEKFKELTNGTIVPAITVGDTVIATYTKDNLDKALDAAGYPGLGEKKEGEEQEGEL